MYASEQLPPQGWVHGGPHALDTLGPAGLSSADYPRENNAQHLHAVLIKDEKPGLRLLEQNIPFCCPGKGTQGLVNTEQGPLCTF